MLRVLATAAELKPEARYCTCCEKPLKGKIAWLELDQRTDTYHDHGEVPPERSQGWFPFGLTCAKNLVKKHDDKLFRDTCPDCSTVDCHANH